MSENFAADDLRNGIERIERLETEKQGIADDIKDTYAEYKAKGFDPKAMRKIIAMRKRDTNDRQTEEAVLATYMAALNMQSGFDF